MEINKKKCKRKQPREREIMRKKIYFFSMWFYFFIFLIHLFQIYFLLYWVVSRRRRLSFIIPKQNQFETRIFISPYNFIQENFVFFFFYYYLLLMSLFHSYNLFCRSVFGLLLLLFFLPSFLFTYNNYVFPEIYLFSFFRTIFMWIEELTSLFCQALS